MTTKDSKIPFRFSAFLGYALSLILLIAGYVVYAYLPINDEFTNSPEVAGSEAVKMFLCSPVCIFVSALIFIVFAVLNRKYFYKLISENNQIGKAHIKDSLIEWVIIIVSFVLFALICVSGVFALMLYKKYVELGFVAPVGDTYFMDYQNFIFGAAITHFVFFVLMTLRMAKINWLNKVVCLINSLIGKIKNADGK